MPSDSPEGLTPREALDRIAALCDKRAAATHGGMRPVLDVEDVRAVLAEVSPEPGGATSDDHQRGYAQGYTEGRAAGWDERGEPGGVLDRDQARDALADHTFLGTNPQHMEQVLDRLAAAVRPAAIDRDALWAIFNDEDVWDQGYPHVIDRIVAALAAEALHWAAEQAERWNRLQAPGFVALAARLEAAQ